MKTRIDNFGIALIVISLLLSGCTAETDPEPIEGCMDELATNFDINADVDDGSCKYADSDGDGVYTVTLSLTVPAIEYKFTVDGWTDQEMFDTTYACTKTSGAFTNRLLEMTGDTL